MNITPQAFSEKKRGIIDSLSRPASEYSDSSPKGTVDDGILELIELINSFDGLVTTSSCAGRLAVFLEGEKTPSVTDAKNKGDEQTLPSVPGGKGGGRWLYVSHTPIPLAGQSASKVFQLQNALCTTPALESTNQGPSASESFIHVKFEPLILHVCAASTEYAQIVLSAALDAGLRESGIQSTQNQFPMVAVRTAGLALSSIVGYVDSESGQTRALVDENYLQTVASLANSRFQANTQRTARFQEALVKSKERLWARTQWEDKTSRAERKKAEGLARQKQIAEALLSSPGNPELQDSLTAGN